MPSSKTSTTNKYYVYVIRLLPTVLQEHDFAKANANHRPDKPCVYVGSSVRQPRTRYEQHVAGYKACKKVTRHHDARYPLIERKQRVFSTRGEAEAYERKLAEELRRKRYAVWQN